MQAASVSVSSSSPDPAPAPAPTSVQIPGNTLLSEIESAAWQLFVKFLGGNNSAHWNVKVVASSMYRSCPALKLYYYNLGDSSVLG